ncbi:DUF6764 family protein [Rhodococcus sp. HNM0569]|uniref:DUF6764 family protein n=1 Tax=Rhodococcus sp. HNM0569 TaxID=2716340 RepID=UPI00146E680D|nr:DUF6764 family protein [Rhodococcus sp. HNM0569]NLU83742.1 protein kinase [Rhodococcus sp. HNM0569]
MKRVTRMAAVVMAAGAAVLGSSLFAAPSAEAAVCIARPTTDTTIVDGPDACRSVADMSSGAAAFSAGGVAVADAAGRGTGLGVGVAGGVGAAEVRDGTLVAVAVGPASVSIGSVTEPLFGVVASGPSGQALVTDDQAECAGTGVAVAWNVATGAACAHDGFHTWAVPGRS